MMLIKNYLQKRALTSSFLTSSSSSFSSSISSISSILDINNEVKEALSNKKPIVALESTIISHGMPYPKNLEVAIKLENIIRSKGAIPATIAIINGKPKIGLTSNELELLSKPSQNTTIIKASRRDIPYACAKNLHAATTVSATMILASQCGIRVFATGGIGGVHRGAEQTMDISADLKELSQTPVTVVCSGVKSILDIPKTLEVLEYQGVPVFGYQTDEFPAFFTNNSGCKSPLVANSPLEIARAMICQDNLNSLNGQGMLVAVPNPQPGNTIHIENAIQQALSEASRDGIHGNAVTPYVLARVKELTHGQSLDANIALVMNNASIAADIANEYTPLAQPYKWYNNQNNSYTKSFTSNDSIFINNNSINSNSSNINNNNNNTNNTNNNNNNNIKLLPSVAIFGGAVIDQMMTPLPSTTLQLHTSNPGNISYSSGGVGRNIAEGLARGKSCIPYLITALGNDNNGTYLLSDSINKGIDMSYVIQPNNSNDKQYTTAIYSAIHNHTGDLLIGMASMSIFKELLTSNILNDNTKLYNMIKNDCKLVIIDGNISIQLFQKICNVSSKYNIPIFFEPTSVAKSILPVESNCLHYVNIMKPNTIELCEIMSKCLLNDKYNIPNKIQITKILSNYKNHDLDEFENKTELLDDMSEIGGALLHLMMMRTNDNKVINNQKHLIISMGKLGILWISERSSIGNEADKQITNEISSKFIEMKKIENIINTNGAGDSFCVGVIVNILNSSSNNLTIHSIYEGMKYAEKTLTTNKLT